MTLVVYPWPESVDAADRNSIQVTHWRAWAASRNVRFIDGFAPFFREPAEVALRKYFIAGDVHFTELGHRLLFDEVKRIESLPGPQVQSFRNPRPGSTP
ncbi:MAG TPA: SGNH/GDSL hydrolase family protein [Reyranella sp.]|jgi:hypothetical protein|nr:SGNH/GDSL hydrolase family protein [Reyranella sp.]